MHHLLLQSQCEMKKRRRSKHTVNRFFQTFPSARKASNLERRKFKIGFPKVEKMNSHHYEMPMFGLFKAKTVGGGHLFGLWLDYFFQKNCGQHTDEVNLYHHMDSALMIKARLVLHRFVCLGRRGTMTQMDLFKFNTAHMSWQRRAGLPSHSKHLVIHTQPHTHTLRQKLQDKYFSRWVLSAVIVVYKLQTITSHVDFIIMETEMHGH